jgi:hypothetical protein
MSKTIYKIFENEKLVAKDTAEGILDDSPDWDGIPPKPGEIINLPGGKAIVKQADHHFPDSDEEDYIIELHLERIKNK